MQITEVTFKWKQSTQLMREAIEAIETTNCLKCDSKWVRAEPYTYRNMISGVIQHVRYR